jgi:hypothetical protein
MATSDYRGVRRPDGVRICRCIGEAQEPLDMRLDLWNHSPTGGEWGYGGSGPAQLALAILADATGDDELALDHHQAFKWEVVARWQRSFFYITRANVLNWVYEHDQEQADKRQRARASGKVNTDPTGLLKDAGEDSGIDLSRDFTDEA